METPSPNPPSAQNKTWSVKYARWIGAAIVAVILGVNIAFPRYQEWKQVREDTSKLEHCFAKKEPLTSPKEIEQAMCACGSELPLSYGDGEKRGLRTRVSFYETIRSRYNLPDLVTVCELQDRMRLGM